MQKTKQKILTSSLDLFNEKGVSAITMGDIAERAGVSNSNVKYHFQDKESIIAGLLDQMIEEIDKEIFDNLELVEKDIFQSLKIYLEYQYKFRFYYRETFSIFMTYPSIRHSFASQGERGKSVMLTNVYILAGKGFLNPVPIERPKMHTSLAYQIWNNFQFLPQIVWFLDSEDELYERGLSSTYDILYPHLSAEGIKSLSESLERALASLSN